MIFRPPRVLPYPDSLPGYIFAVFSSGCRIVSRHIQRIRIRFDRSITIQHRNRITHIESVMPFIAFIVIVSMQSYTYGIIHHCSPGRKGIKIGLIEIYSPRTDRITIQFRRSGTDFQIIRDDQPSQIFRIANELPFRAPDIQGIFPINQSPSRRSLVPGERISCLIFQQIGNSDTVLHPRQKTSILHIKP